MNEIDIALNYLNQDPVLHVDMLEALRWDEADVAAADAEGVLLRHHSRGLYLLSVRDVKAATRYLSAATDAEAIVARQNFCLPLAHEICNLDYAVPCIQHAYLGNQPIPYPQINAQVKPLTTSDLSFVAEHYSLQLDKQYLLERLQKQAIYGIFYQGNLAGFAGFHAEGSMGMLEILPEWRQRGFGYYLQAFMTNLTLQQGRIPYTQVKDGNEASLYLQQKSGFTAARQPVYWLLRSSD